MPEWLYADHLGIDKEFIDIYTEEEDRRHPKAWRSFIPHGNMIQLLEKVMSILERKDPKPPFIYGPYGTGKTQAAFVIKHLLEDDLSEVQSYFEKYPSTRPLWPRWRAIREKGPYLVVYRSGSGDATNAVRLTSILQERIARALQERGCGGWATKTLRRLVVERLTDPQSTFDWPRAFEKHRSRFNDFADAQKVIDRLKEEPTGSLEAELSLLELTERVMKVLEDEGILVRHTIESLKDWLIEVIERHRLQAVLFLWDEFTDFFRVREAPKDLVQELAHLAKRAPFYLGLITHQNPEILTGDAKFLERFHRHALMLEDVTAYRLMGGVLTVRTEHRDEWERKRETLWSQVKHASPFVMGVGHETREDLRHLVPIHPYTALLLARVARQFSSSQRTLFRFMKEERPGRLSFPRFLREYPRNGWYWLTADFLWDYFYCEDDPEYPEEVRRFITQYRANVERIADETERRVYKVVLLLDLLHRRVGRTGGGVDIESESGKDISVEPTRSRLERVFEGVLPREKVRSALDTLCRGYFLQSYRIGENVRYTLPLGLIDEERVAEIRKQIERTNSFAHLAGEAGEIGQKIEERLRVGVPLQHRQRLRLVSAEEFLNRRERVLLEGDLAPYQMGVVLVLPFKEDEVEKAKGLAGILSTTGERVIYGVANRVFGEQRWDEWLDTKARERYSREVGEIDSERAYRQQAQEIISTWVNDVITYGFQMYFRGRPSAPVLKENGYEQFLEETVEVLYPHRPEKMFPMQPLYTGSWGKQAAEIGLKLVSKLQYRDEYVVNQLKKWGFWESKSDEWSANHPLTLMKREIEAIFEASGSLKLSEIWELLMAPPYGLIPSRLGIMLFGFLLHDCVEGNYYSDGPNCHALSGPTLAQLLENVAKEKKGAKDYIIRKMLPAEEKACTLLRELFGLAPEDTRYLRSTIVALRNHLKNKIGYPVWALRYSIGFEAETVGKALEAIQRILVAGADYDTSDREQLETLERVLSSAAPHFRDRADKKGYYEQGLQAFVAQKNPELARLVTLLGVETYRLVEKLRRLLPEEVYLWEENRVESRLPHLRDELTVTAAVNDLCAGAFKEFSAALTYLCEDWLARFGKLPLWLLAEVADEEVRDALVLLREMDDARNIDPSKEVDRLRAWAERTPVLQLKKEEIRRALVDQRTALVRWVQSSMEEELSLDDADELLRALPDQRTARREDIEGYVRKYLNEQERRRLITALRRLWQELTGIASPNEWAQKFGFPLHFLTDKRMERAVDVVGRPLARATIVELKEAFELLEARRDEVALFGDQEWVRSKFLEHVVGNYAVLVESELDFREVVGYLQEKLGPDLLRWDLQHAQKAVERWADEYYRRTGLARLMRALRDLPLEHAKPLLEELAQDPLVGLVLLRRLSK